MKYSNFSDLTVCVHKSYVAHGVLRMKHQIDNTLKVGFKAYNMAGGQYKLFAERVLGPPCEMMYEDHMRPTIEEFIAATNLSFWSWGLCPFPSNYMFLNNYAPSQIGNYLPPYLPGGEKWKASFFYLDEKETVLGGATIYATLRSNYSLMRYGG
jgi:hypothetical protein